MSWVSGFFYDGETAGRHSVTVEMEEGAGALLLTGPTLDDVQRWPLHRLRALSDHARETSLTLTLHARTKDESLRVAARLIITDKDLIARLKKLCPDLSRQDMRIGSWQKIVKRSALAAGALALMVFVILPRMANTLAELIPVDREIAFGKSVTAQMETALGASKLWDLHCSNAEGNAALERLVARLTKGQALQYRPEVQVLNHKMVNAFAAPGGQIVMMRGLIDNATGPETVAAVLAHEIGHVERRDATRHALRAAGSAGLLSMAMGDFTGGAIAVFLGERLLQASYTREAETEADAFALEMLNASGVDSTGMADFFDQMQKLEGQGPEVLTYFSTHPASASRAAQAQGNAATQVETTPALNKKDWAALKAICG